MVSRIDAQGHHLGHERHMVGHGAKLHRHLKFESAIKGPHVLGAVTEEQMQKCFSKPCGGTARCTGNTPEQTDGQDYEMIQE